MRRFRLFGVIVLPYMVTGCLALLPMTGASTGGGSEAPTDLRTMIMATGLSYDESLAFEVNRAAYAAVFRIIPGQGARMIYPRPGYGSPDGFLFSGFYPVLAPGEDGTFLSSRDAGGVPTRQVPIGAGSDSGPEYYFVVASEDPLRLDSRLYGSDRWLQAAMDGPGMMNWIASQIVPGSSDSRWTTDYYVHWPEAIATSGSPGFVPLTCDGKRVWANPAMYDRAVSLFCGDGPAGAEGRSRPQPAGPGGSEAMVEPQRREALPAASERIASRQLQEPERGEEARNESASSRRAALPIAPLTGPDPLGPTERMELERLLRELEGAGGLGDPFYPTSDLPARGRPVGVSPDDDLTRPGLAAPRLRPTFEVPDPSPPPVLQPWVESPPSAEPLVVPDARAPGDGSDSEEVPRRRPTIE